MVNVRFSDLHGQLSAEANFETATKIKDVVADGVSRLGFPSHYDDGAPIKYRARELSTGALLGPEQEVADLQEPDPVVQLIPEVPAA